MWCANPKRHEQDPRPPRMERPPNAITRRQAKHTEEDHRIAPDKNRPAEGVKERGKVRGKRLARLQEVKGAAPPDPLSAGEVRGFIQKERKDG